MIFIPGFLISMLTFPGVIVHEAAHQLMCRLTGTPVLAVCYFQVGDTAGYVIHDSPSSGWKHFLIAFAPFLINSILAVLICLPAALATASDAALTPTDVFLAWLGISVGMHAFPSIGDASALWAAMKNEKASWLLKITTLPAVAVIYIGAGLSAFWVDAIYAALLCFGLPLVVLEMVV
ncbi:metalloprotease family protein [Prosthecobacter sp.]|uniref:metalloprotease family protein n=1 Tax=Prosthecobacter sp. TaxID=1965333 RepID=UPI0037830481